MTAAGLSHLVKPAFVTFALYLSLQSFEWPTTSEHPTWISIIQPSIVVAAEEDTDPSGHQTIEFENCDEQLSEVTKVAISGCRDPSKVCRLKSGTKVDVLVEFTPEKDYDEVLLSIDLHSPVSLSLVSREQVCGSQLACPLVKGQKASLLRKDVAVEVPFYVPEFLLENVELNATIVEDKDDGEDGELVSCFMFVVSVDKE